MCAQPDRCDVISYLNFGFFDNDWRYWYVLRVQSEYSLMVLGDQRNHALLSVQGNQQYHAAQQDLEVQEYQQSPVK